MLESEEARGWSSGSWTSCPGCFLGRGRLSSLRWTKVVAQYQAKSVHAQNDLESAFFDMHFQRGGDVRAFLTTLRYKCEELAAAGVSITNRDYQRTVFRGIPNN